MPLSHAPMTTATDMLDVSQYGVKADGKNGDYYVTYQAGGTTLSLFTLSANVTVANVAGQAQVSYPYSPDVVVPRMGDIGCNCHVPGVGIGGTDFVSPIVRFHNNGDGEVT